MQSVLNFCHVVYCLEANVLLVGRMFPAASFNQIQMHLIGSHLIHQSSNKSNRLQYAMIRIVIIHEKWQCNGNGRYVEGHLKCNKT